MKTYRIVSERDCNDYFTVTAASLEDAAFLALEQLGRQVVEFDADFDQTQAAAEGWGIFNDDPAEIQRLDETEVFATDEDAIEFVRRRAAEGSEYHRRASDICNL